MEDKINQTQENLIKILLANTASATKISNILTEHSQDKIMKADEIICGLIYRLMIPMTDQEIQDSMSEAESLMYDSSSEEEDNLEDMIGGGEIIDDTDDLSITRKIKTNTCNCDICMKTRVCLLNFNDYIPKDELGDKFKCSIIETCQQYNRTI